MADQGRREIFYFVRDSRTGRSELPKEAIIPLRKGKPGFDQEEFFVNSDIDIVSHSHVVDAGQVFENESHGPVKEMCEEDDREDHEEYPVRRPVNEMEQLGFLVGQLVDFQLGEIRDTDGNGAHYQGLRYPYCQESLVLHPDDFPEKIQGSCAGAIEIQVLPIQQIAEKPFHGYVTLRAERGFSS